jgi:hypothetical protein
VEKVSVLNRLAAKVAFKLSLLLVPQQSQYPCSPKMSNDEGDPWDDTALIKAYDAAIAGARGLTIVRKLSLILGSQTIRM